MKALRPDEDKLSPIHSVYVDQWDWEKVICENSERSLAKLKETVETLYRSIKATEKVLRMSLALRHSFLRKLRLCTAKNYALCIQILLPSNVKKRLPKNMARYF